MKITNLINNTVYEDTKEKKMDIFQTGPGPNADPHNRIEVHTKVKVFSFEVGCLGQTVQTDAPYELWKRAVRK